jgi:hypothetical protein
LAWSLSSHFRSRRIAGSGHFLTLTSKPEETSPTERGLFIREHFLCQKVPPPPPGVSASLPPLSESKPMTSRERLQVHLSNESCASCHRLIDPIGFGLEKFDAIGRKREKLGLTFFVARGETERKPTRVELNLTPKAGSVEFRTQIFQPPPNWGGCWPAMLNARSVWSSRFFGTRWAGSKRPPTGQSSTRDLTILNARNSSFSSL